MSSIRKAVFPAAGLGTRFLPASKASPKEMLPLVDKPLIQYVVEEAVAAGIAQIIIITGRHKRAIEDHFDNSPELERFLEERDDAEMLREVKRISNMVQMCYVRQKEALGLGHAVLTVNELVGNEPFAVLLGDDIIESEVPCIRQLIDVYERHGGPVVALMRVPAGEISKYGVVRPAARGIPREERVHLIEDLVEKPAAHEAPSDLAIIGRYILTPDIFGALERTPFDGKGELQLTNGIKALLSSRKVYGCEFTGRRYDAGDKLGFLEATVEFALRRPDLGREFREYLKGLKL